MPDLTPPPNESHHPQSNSSRTLNVKDALSYLEQVRFRFQYQNEVYNQFLDVMKLFKTQSIDTPGVIERVSTIFRGYPSLIQGFNTFLPPGFRIECSLVRQIDSIDKEADLVTFYTPGEITHKTSLFPRDRSPAIILTDLPIGSLPSGWIHVPSDSPSCSSHKDLPDPESPSDSSNIPLGPSDQPHPPPATDQLEHNLPTILNPSISPSHKNSKASPLPPHDDPSDATITTIIKCRSTTPLDQEQPRPHSQNSNFPALSQALNKNQVNHEHSTTTSKSSSRNLKTHPRPPSTGPLSRGQSPNVDGLIAPPAPHSRVPTPTYEYPKNSRPTRSISTSHTPTRGQNYTMDPFTSNNSKLNFPPDLKPADSTQKGFKRHSSQQPKPPVSTRPNSIIPPTQPSVLHLQPTKPVEFNYAISYVNKIKLRFIDQPEIYKTFLEILQTYQKDGMPIDSVFVNVTKLFSNATDLLDEFKQFLPDLNASTATGQVPKYTFPTTSKTSFTSKLLSNIPSSTSQVPSSSSTNLAHDQPENSLFMAHPQPLSHAPLSLKSSHKPKYETLSQHRSQPFLKNDPSTDAIFDSARRHNKKFSPSRSQNHSKVASTLADLPMVLDPQVLSNTATSTLDPQVLNHAQSNTRLPAVSKDPFSNTHSNSVLISNDLSPHGKPSNSHLTTSALPDSLPLHQKRLFNSHVNPILPDEESYEPPRKKRAPRGPLKNSSREGASPAVIKDSYNLTVESDSPAQPSEGLITKKTKRSKSKNTIPEPIAPAVSSEWASHEIPTFSERRRSPQPHLYEEAESTSYKIVGLSDQYEHQSNVLPYHVIDGSSSTHVYPPLQLVQDPHLGTSALTDYSTGQPSYIETHDAMGGRTLTNTKELTLFESIKKYLKDHEVWLEFLRVLDLYNQSIIDFKTLLDRVSVFIGDDDVLLEDFKGLVGYDVKNDGLVEGEVWEIKNRDIKERDKVDASTIRKEYGPSYKRLPRAEIDLACSGRDELCWSVLNDEYFGAATFGTESGGPGHRKTNFEEVIAMTEGERAHFSYWLECISRTIGHFESLQARIDRMEDEDKVNFTLGENLGGISPSIYHRTLGKVYEAKYQTSILPYLRDYPVNTIPIVLRRLKELELSWKSAESQWNLIWREVERKNYYKAQDHQVLAFKSAEKSLLKSQNLLKEIQDLKSNNQQALIHTLTMKEEEEEEEEKGENRQASSKMLEDRTNQPSLFRKVPITLTSKIPEKVIPSPIPSRSSHQIELGFQDMQVFFDVLRIIIMALDRSTLSNPERRRIDESIRTFIPAIWNISSSELEKQIPIIYDDESSGGEASEEDGGHPNQTNQNPGDGRTPTMDQQAKQNLFDQKGIQTLTAGLLKIQQSTQQESSSEQRQSTRSHNLDTPISSPSHSYQLTPAEFVSGINHQHTPCAQHHCPAPEACLNGNYNDTNELNRASFTGLNKWTKLHILDFHVGNYDGQNRQQPVDRRFGRWYNVFGTFTYYLLIRLLHTLYSRLLKVKTIGMKLSQEKPSWRRINPVAIELGLSHPIIGLDDHPHPSTQLYPYCLDQLSRYFDGEIDLNTFEESIRVAFPKHGYLLSTVDKLTNSILKQFAQIHQEPKNKEFLNLVKRERSLNSHEPIVQISYRNQAESIIRTTEAEREETLIRAEWHPDRMSLSVQVLNEDDSTFELIDPIDRLNHYVDTFEFDIDSELVQISKVRKPFLRANLSLVNSINKEDEDGDDDDDDNKNDEMTQLSQNGTKKDDNKSEKEEKQENGTDHQTCSIIVEDTPIFNEEADHMVIQKRKNKRKRKARRVVLINQSNIRISIDPKTYKLKFNHRLHESLMLKGDINRYVEPTDLLLVKNLESPPFPANTTTITMPPKNPNGDDLHIRQIDLDRVEKFESWLANCQRKS